MWPDDVVERRIEDCKALWAAVNGLLLAVMPIVHLKVLRVLLLFLRLASLPKYAETSKMGVSNLALVLAPNVLRSPGLDPMVELQNTKPLNALMMFLIIHVRSLDFSPREV